MSARAASGQERSGILPARDEKPPAFAHALRLYKGDMFFRSLVDLAVVGLLVVAVVADWSDIGKKLARTVGAMGSSLTPAQKHAQQAVQRLTDHEGPGADVIAGRSSAMRCGRPARR